MTPGLSDVSRPQTQRGPVTDRAISLYFALPVGREGMVWWDDIDRHAPVDFVGVQDSFGRSAENYEILLQHFGLTAAAVADAVERLLRAA